MFLHMLRHLSLMLTEVRPGGKGYLVSVRVRVRVRVRVKERVKGER